MLDEVEELNDFVELIRTRHETVNKKHVFQSLHSQGVFVQKSPTFYQFAKIAMNLSVRANREDCVFQDLLEGFWEQFTEMQTEFLSGVVGVTTAKTSIGTQLTL